MVTMSFILALGTMSVMVREDIGMQAGHFGAIFAAFFASSALVSVLGGSIGRRAGAVQVMIASMGTLAAAMLAMATVVTTWWAVIPVAVASGAANGSVQPAVNRYVAATVRTSGQGLAFAIKQCSIPLAGFLIGVAVPLLGVPFGWRWVYVLGACSAILVGMLLWLALGRRAPILDTPREHRAAMRSDRGLLVRIALFGFCGSFAGNATTAYFVQSSVDRGMAVASAALVLSLGNAIGVAIRLGLGRAADVWPYPLWLVMCWQFAVWAGGFGLLAFASHTYLIVAGAVLAFGVGWGWPGLYHLALARARPGAVGATTGVAMIGIFGGGVVGPVAFSLALHVGSYLAAWLLLVVLAGSAAWLARSIHTA